MIRLLEQNCPEIIIPHFILSRTIICVGGIFVSNKILGRVPEWWSGGQTD